MTRTPAVLSILAILTVLFSLAQEPPKTVPEAKPPQEKDSKAARRSIVRVQVLGDGQAVPGATVRLKSADGAYDQEKPTNANGVATFPSAPRGRIDVQVTAAGWDSFGKQYQITTEDQTVPAPLTKH